MTAPARRLGDRYVLEAPLGAGGMGSIFRGRDERLGQTVAIKILKRTLVDDPVVRERFRREALSLAQLRVEGIARVLDFGEADGDLFTVLELVAGETLERRLTEPMPIETACSIVERILAALETCHDGGIVHRDVKPANVIVGEGDAVTLIDFGLARIARIGGDSVDKITETGAIHGTPHYMAPEQCRGEDVGPPSDVYAAGVVFYEMLAGASPYQGKDAASLMAQHLFVEPPPLRAVAPHVSAGLSALVQAMLAKRPEDRPSAAEARRTLAAALAGTDAEAAATVKARDRREAAGQSRAERALGTSDVASASASIAEGKTIVWTSSSDRSAALRGCLSVAGLPCIAATSSEPPAIGPRDVVVVSSADGLARVRALGPGVTIVVDVASPEHTTEAIRAGAGDMLLAEAPDADLVGKARRLLRRRARS